MPETAPVTTIIEAIASRSLDYALLLAAIGTLSMALVELLKGLTGARRHFHRREIHRWIPDLETRSEMLVLAAGGAENADILYDQPVERMMGQIQAAANLALDYPDRYPHAYAFFTREDMKMQAGAVSDRERWEHFALQIMGGGPATDAQPSRTLEIENRAANQARARLGHLIARRLDMFQNHTHYRWARFNQMISILTGSLITAYALAGSTRIDSVTDIMALACLSLSAGMLAPFAKDVVSAISGLRARA